ncbi:MAG: hypothetical protein PHU63_00920 [Candidatus ainarchaeum sp.]|nr:hypothetical protein [Candidatus ainarchaeum sp.]
MYSTRKTERQNSLEQLSDIMQNLQKLSKIKTSILDTISYRIALSTHTWKYGIFLGLPEETLKKLPKEIASALQAYYLLSKEISFLLSSLKNADETSLKTYFGLRKKILEAAVQIQQGLLSESVTTMLETASILISTLKSSPNNVKKGDFQTFFEKYSECEEYFRRSFLFSFPEKYDPSFASEYDEILQQSFAFEITSIDYALAGKFELAFEELMKWFSFMQDFVGRSVIRESTPKTID